MSTNQNYSEIFTDALSEPSFNLSRWKHVFGKTRFQPCLCQVLSVVLTRQAAVCKQQKVMHICGNPFCLCSIFPTTWLFSSTAIQFEAIHCYMSPVRGLVLKRELYQPVEWGGGSKASGWRFRVRSIPCGKTSDKVILLTPQHTVQSIWFTEHELSEKSFVYIPRSISPNITQAIV